MARIVITKLALAMDDVIVLIAKYPENSSDDIFAERRRHREMPITYRFDVLELSMLRQ
jgi:hypothetical protein